MPSEKQSYEEARALSNIAQRSTPEIEWEHDDVNGLLWNQGIGTPPSQSEIDAEITRFRAEDIALAYREKRRREYPRIGDQLDALYHAGSLPTDLTAQIKAVKDKYPKP